METGHVWIVGAGPGDPGLLTVAGAEALAQADTVLYDALSSPALLRRAKPGAELVYVGKRAGAHAMPQAEIEARMVASAREGRHVVRLKGGDPFVFGRGGEEALACREADIPFTVVPGISSAIAAPAYAGIPVTHRKLATNFMVITGSEAGEDGSGIDWEAASRAGTLIILMGASTLGEHMASLMAAGTPPETPAACVRWGTRPDQQAVSGTVSTIAGIVKEAGLTAPMVTVVGPVAALGEQLRWFEPGPLAGKLVAVTRSSEQSGQLAALLEAEGADTLEAPVISIRPRCGDAALQGALSERWDWVLFTSVNAVEAVFAALLEMGRDARAFGGTKVASIGAATAEALRSRGIIADFIPSRGTGEVLGGELPLVGGERVLLPVSALSGDGLVSALKERGALPHCVTAYDNLPAALTETQLADLSAADAITFTSASTARYLRESLEAAGAPMPGGKLVSIGPQTSAAVRDAFGRVDAEAAETSLASLVAATMEALQWDS